MKLNAKQRAELLGDLHVYGGAVVLSVGAWFAYPPAGPIVFGGFICGLGLLWRGRS